MPDTSKQSVPRWSQTTPCDICGLLIGVAGMKKHVKNHELDNLDPADLIRCPYKGCPYRMKAKQINHLYPHIRSEHTKAPLICPICKDFQTFHDSAYSRHFKTQHPQDKKPVCWAPPMPKSLICPVCDNFRTHTENAFVGHWKSRHAKLEFPHQILERRRRLDATQTEDVEEDDDDDMEEVQDGVGVGTRGVGKFEPREEEYGSDMDMDYDEGYGPAPRLVSLLPNHPMPIPRNPSPFEGWAPSFGFSRLQPQPSHNQPQRRASDYESSSSSSSRPPSPQHSSEGRRRRYHPAPLPPATPPPPIPGPTLAPLMNHYVAANQNSSTRRHSLPLPSFASMFPYDTGTGAGGLASGHHRPGFAPPRKVSMPVPTLLRRESDVLIKMEEEDMY